MNLKKVKFSVGQGAEYYFKVTFANLNHRFLDFIKLHFRLVQRPKFSLECHTSPWNIAFSTSPMSPFGMVKRPKMSSKCWS